MKDFRLNETTAQSTMDKDNETNINSQHANYNSSQVKVDDNSETSFFCAVYKWMFIGLAILVLSSFIAPKIAYIKQIIDFVDIKQLIDTFDIKRIIVPANTGRIGLLFAMLYLYIVIPLFFYIYVKLKKGGKSIIIPLFIITPIYIAPLIVFTNIIFPEISIIQAIACATATYGIMAFFVMITKKSLQPLTFFLFMILAGSIIASVMNMFMANSMKAFITSIIGVILFAILTACFYQKLCALNANRQDSSDTTYNLAALGAFSIYFHFFNPLLFLVDLFLKRK